MEYLEGRQSVLAALEARQRRFECVLVNQSLHEEKVRDVLDLAGAMGIAIKRVSGRELNNLAHGATHGGVMAVCSPKPLMDAGALLDLVRQTERPLLLLLEGVDDARNLGFTLRSAHALGATAVVIKKHLWDFDPTEIARPASGAYEKLPLVRLDDTTVIELLRRDGVQLLGCLAGVKRTIYQADLSGGIILAIGGEKRGLSNAVRSQCDAFVTIPTQEGASSLPLSHAAAIVLAEAKRQRDAK